MTPTRSLAYRFIMLPYHVKIQVQESMGLLQKEDAELSESDRTNAFFKRVREAGLHYELWEEINKNRKEEMPNPFPPKEATPQPHPDVLAWEKWKASPEGKAAMNAVTLGINTPDVYLLNRLEAAFMAGVKSKEGEK